MAPSPSPRAEEVRRHFDRMAPELETWRRRNRFYHDDHVRYFRHLVGPGKRVLELGSGNGDLLAALEPTLGVGLDLSPAMVELARGRHPSLRFEVGDESALERFEGETFDAVILSDLVGFLEDVQHALERVHRVCGPSTRVVIAYYNFLWEPILELGERLGRKMPTPEQSWLSLDDLRGLLALADFEVVKSERRLLFPLDVPLLGAALNHLGNLPGLNALCLSDYVVARPLPRREPRDLSVTVVVPCRNERGNVEAAVTRLPRFGREQEILFVDGHSTDGTQDEIARVAREHPDRGVRFLAQRGTGKGDAVRQGFAEATGDVLMILDADLTVPPEDLPKFFHALATGRAEFVNGCRLVYPMEDEAMRTLNRIANKAFALVFSWLLGQRFKDTLCGTKALSRPHYSALAAQRSYFGDFDPFGDFDLIFGASKLNLKIAEIPVRYRNRSYGETKIHRFRHGWMLLRMVVHAYRKLKSA